MNKLIHLFTLNGIPVAVTPWFFCLMAILAMLVGNGSFLHGIMFAVVGTISIGIHEFGHATVANHYGLNPQVILGGLGGLTQHRSANAKQSFWITLWGPLSDLILAALSFGIIRLLSMLAPTFLPEHAYMLLFLTYMLWINFVWGVFNLLPIYPMDGGKLCAAILAKFFKPGLALKIGCVISAICCLGLAGWAVADKQIFMIFIAFYMLIINFAGMKTAFAKREDTIKEQASLQAEIMYEKGLVAAREHRWEDLEKYGHQMKACAETKDQRKRAYEFLTIACTNTFKYEDALEYSKHASQTDAVKQAVARCKNILKT